MRFRFVAHGVALLISSTLFAAPPPSVIFSRADTQTPIFISASAMFAADGTTADIVPLDWRAQQQRLAVVVSEHRSQVSALNLSSAAPCQAGMLAESPLEPLVDTTTQHNAIVNAHAIIAGTIRSVTPGFFFGTPGSLIELEDLDKIKADASYSSVRQSLNLRLPYAQFVAGGTEYCREAGPEAYAPKVGDHLLLFAYGTPVDVSGTFVYSTSNDMIAQPHDGAIRIPRSPSFFDNDTTLAKVAIRIRSELSRGDRPVGHDRKVQ